ncbi:MAG TPA: energy-coupling factor transporter transmembrane component T [Polyangiaceae bacterium]|nr:energy-coupling factor transporter transmembrane component T [Polyangiaceae bacterium]
MRTSLHELWGCGRGPVRRAAPPTRLLAGLAAFGGCMISSGATVAGSLCATSIAGVWVLGCRPPGRVLRGSIVLGLALLLPYFLLLPLLPSPPGETAASWREALLVPWALLLRGLTGMVISVATVTVLTGSDLREALLRLPVPSLLSVILLQIVHQTATLLYETRRVAEAMAVRGASSGGLTAWRVLFSLPQVWLPRVILRAERVGAAMELRGYCDGPPPSFTRSALGRRDVAVLGTAAGALGLAISLRLWGAP